MLRCEGESVCETIQPIAETMDPSAITLKVERKLRFRVRRSSTESVRADTLGVVRANDSNCFLYLPGGYGGSRVPLDGLQDQTIATSETARFLVLFRSGAELRRVPLGFEGDVVLDVEL